MKTAFLAVLFLLPTLAAAKNETGRDLLDDCSLAVKLFDNETVVGEDNFIKIGYCLGFVTGVTHTAALWDASYSENRQAKRGMEHLCAPTSVTAQQIIRVVVKWLKANPEKLHLDASDAILWAMKEGFPCP